MTTPSTERERLARLLSRAADHADRLSLSEVALQPLLRELDRAIQDRERFPDSVVEQILRARAPEDLRSLMAELLSDTEAQASPEQLTELTELLAAVVLIEETSLGTPKARQIRETTASADLAAVERLSALLEQADAALTSELSPVSPDQPAASPPDAAVRGELEAALRLIDQVQLDMQVQQQNITDLRARLERLRDQIAGKREDSPRLRPMPPAPDVFWGSLTAGQRQKLLALGHMRQYRSGDVLCREGEPGHDVIVILSGQTRVWSEKGDQRQSIGLRGPGELVGERAVLAVRSRSATVTAEGDVQALRIEAADFATFLDDHPHVVALLEREAYEKLTGPRPVVDQWWPKRSEVPSGNSVILATDLHGFASPGRTEDDRRFLRNNMYTMLKQAFDAVGIDFSGLHLEDRGDGALIVVPPDTATRTMIEPIAAHLAGALHRHNRRIAPPARMQLRLAAHVGYVDQDSHGLTGSALITTFRLLDAPALKQRLAETNADLGLVVSQTVFPMIEPASRAAGSGRYSPIAVNVKETQTTAWMRMVGGAQTRRALKDQPGRAATLNNLGLALRGAGRLEEAITTHTEALRVYREIGDRSGEGQALEGLGLALQEAGRFEEAITAHTHAATILEEGDDDEQDKALRGAAAREAYGKPIPPAQIPDSPPQARRAQSAVGLAAHVSSTEAAPVPATAADATEPSLAQARTAAFAEGQSFGRQIAQDAPAVWLQAVLARKPRMPADLEARLLQQSALSIDYLLRDEVRHALRRGFWDVLEHPASDRRS